MRRVLSYLAIAVACALLFLIPSAYAVERGAPIWIAAVIGGLAFPVLPAVWHLVGERRRRARKAAAAAAAKAAIKPRAELSGRDRLALRMIAVAVVAIAPLVALDRGGVWRGMRDHALWFVPQDPAFDPGHAGALVAILPGDADGVIVMRDHPMKLVDPGYADPGAMAIAWHGTEMMAAVPNAGAARQMIDDVRGRMANTPFGKMMPAYTVTERGSVAVLATGTWGTTGTGPGPRLRALLLSIPTTALIAAAFAPATPGADGITDAVVWLDALGGGAGGARVHARLVLADAAAAEKLAATITAGLAQAGQAPTCTAAVTQIAGAIQVARTEAVVTLGGDVPGAALAAVVTCLKGGTL
jgi:hypothetical protein